MSRSAAALGWQAKMLLFPHTGLRFQFLNLPEEIDLSRDTVGVGVSEFDLASEIRGKRSRIAATSPYCSRSIEFGARYLGPTSAPALGEHDSRKATGSPSHNPGDRPLRALGLLMGGLGQLIGESNRCREDLDRSSASGSRQRLTLSHPAVCLLPIYRSYLHRLRSRRAHLALAGSCWGPAGAIWGTRHRA